jgi:hypothetical protein
MMSGWMKAHIDNTGDTVYLNLDHAVRIEQQSPGSTLVEFPNGPRIVGVSEAPDELLRRIGWVDSIQERRPGDPDAVPGQPGYSTKPPDDFWPSSHHPTTK